MTRSSWHAPAAAAAILIGIIIAVPIVYFVFFAGPSTPITTSHGAPPGGSTTKLTTSDGWVIVASDYGAPASGSPGVILIHGVNESRAVWDPTARLLASRGYAVISFDLRGHGQSTSFLGQKRTWTSFSPSDWQGAVEDIEAARLHLLDRHAVTSVVTIGASIGANLALSHAAIHPGITGVITLSAAGDYRGVDAVAALVELQNRTPAPRIVFVAALDDPTGAADQTELLAEEYTGEKRQQVLSTGGHGTNLLAGGRLDAGLLEWVGWALGGG